MSHILEGVEGGQLDGLKVSVIYNYKASDKLVFALDKNMASVVSIFNITLNRMLFIAGNETYPGVVDMDKITYATDSTGAANSDILYIIYKPLEETSIPELLGDIKELLTEQIVQAKITNQILTESTEVDLHIDKIQF